MVLPDTRAVSLKGVGNQTINTRVKIGPASVGSVIEDTVQGHYHEFPDSEIRGFSGGSHSWAPGGFNVMCVSSTGSPITDGTNGTPRTGAQTQDCTIGTNFGITY